jgi:hypothetical protein
MRWLIENPQLLIVLAGAIAYWLNERRKAKETKQEMEAELKREPTSDEMAERTRRIQEEIRRKIEERQGRTSQPTPFDEEPGETVAVPPPATAVPPSLPEPRPVAVSIEEATGAVEVERVMEQQRRYAEQLDQLAAAERAARARSSVPAAPVLAVYSTTAATLATKPAHRGGVVLPSLHDRDALRRAIVLREVLGAPKALQ